MRKRTVLIGLVLIAAAGGGWYYYKNYYNQEKLASAESAEGSVYMSKVSDIMDQGALGVKTRLVGVVDPQESKDIKLDSDKQLKETFVEVGDEVKKGDPLFSYDVEAMKQKIQLERPQPSARLYLSGLYPISFISMRMAESPSSAETRFFPLLCTPNRQSMASALRLSLSFIICFTTSCTEVS